MKPLSVADVVAFTARFCAGNFVAILSRVIVPAIIGWAILYFSFNAYLSELIRYLAAPSDRIGSLVLGLATAGLMAALFFHAVITAAVAGLALGQKEDGGWIYLRAARREWRLYAATLRVAVLGFAFVVIAIVAEIFLHNLISSLWIKIILFAGLFAIFVRLGFLLPAISVAFADGPVVRRVLRFSQGHSGLIGLSTLLFIIPGLAAQFGGEYLMRGAGLVPSHPQVVSLIDMARLFQRFLPEFLAVLSLAYLVTAVLLTVSSVRVYHALSVEDRAGI